jgi:hypothetical protein
LDSYDDGKRRNINALPKIHPARNRLTKSFSTFDRDDLIFCDDGTTVLLGAADARDRIEQVR